MKIRVAVVAAIILAFSGLSAAAQQFAPGPAGRVATVRTTADVNLRTGPSVSSRTLTRIPRGRTVQLLGCVPNFVWCRTSYAGRVGWVSAAYLAPRPGARSFPRLPFPIPFPEPQQPPPQAGQVTVSGTLTREGVECPAMRGDNGRLYTLAGDTGRVQPGDHVRVRGTLAQISTCQQGTTIRVESIGPG
jgi:uncharacterized protein YgiM (DUF1202 family)